MVTAVGSSPVIRSFNLSLIADGLKPHGVGNYVRVVTRFFEFWDISNVAASLLMTQESSSDGCSPNGHPKRCMRPNWNYGVSVPPDRSKQPILSRLFGVAELTLNNTNHGGELNGWLRKDHCSQIG